MTRRLLAFLLVALIVACAPDNEGPADHAAPGLTAPEVSLAWPQPPEKPRIKFLYAFRQAKDLGFRTPFIERVWDWLAGEDERGLVRPYGIAAEGQKVVVADPGSGVVHLFDRGAEQYTRITEAGEEILLSPVGVAIAPNRTYVADSALGKVFAFDEEGQLLLTIDGLERPTGLAYERDSGRLYAVDTLGHGISVFDKEGKELFSFGQRGAGDGEFNFPSHLFLRAEKLYVNDTMNFRLQAFDLEGNHLFSIGTHGDGSGDFAQSKGVGVDEAGHLYVVDTLFNRVQIFDSRGRLLLSFGEQGGRVGEFWLPSGLFIDRDRIYVADSYNRRVQVFQFLGGG